MVAVKTRCARMESRSWRDVLCNVPLFILSLALGVSSDGCPNSPIWMFSLPEDLISIYGVTYPVIIVEEGVATPVLNSLATAALFAIGEGTPEFPLVWCSTGTKRVNYTLTLISNDTSALSNPLLSVPVQGILPKEPFRFHVCFPCHSDVRTRIPITVIFDIESDDGIKYCQIQFFIVKICTSSSSNYDNCSISQLGIQDGPVNISGILTKNDTTAGSQTESQKLPIPLIVSFILAPITVLALLLTIIIGVVIWYQRRSKTIIFQPEAISLAYSGVCTAWNQRELHENEYPTEKLTIVRELGEGAFGIVYEAKALDIENNGEVSIVAVKQLRGESDPQVVVSFFREVDFMSRLDHERIVRLLGICSQLEPFSMIFEYMDLGDLRSFLREAAGLGMGEEEEEEEEGGAELKGGAQDNPLLTTAELLTIAEQVAEGMVYISSKHLVHRDLATRNCLVATGLVVKIGDFGLSKDVYSSDYYRVHGSAVLPIRWMSQESILYGKFSSKTDVWAFGVLLWEIFTFGQQPYTGLTNEEVIAIVGKGGHPEPLTGWPTAALMKSCWKQSARARPSFEAITATLHTLLSSCTS